MAFAHNTLYLYEFDDCYRSPSNRPDLFGSSTKGIADGLSVRIALQHFSSVMNSEYPELKESAAAVLTFYVAQRTAKDIIPGTDRSNNDGCGKVKCEESKDVLFAKQLISMEKEF